MLLALLALLVLTLWAGPSAPPPSDHEHTLAADAVALSRSLPAGLDGAAPGASLQVTVYALVRPGEVSALQAAREAALLASIVAAGLTWLLARRLGLSTTSSVAAVALAGATPWAVVVHQLAEPAGLAVPWLLVGFLTAGPLFATDSLGTPIFASAPVRHRAARWGVAVASVSVVVVTAPVAAVVVAGWLAVLLTTGGLGTRWPVAVRATVAGVLALTAFAVAAAVFGAGSAVAAVPVSVWEAALGVAALAAAGLGIADLSTRSLGYFVLVTAAGGLVGVAAGTPAAASTLLLAVPVAAVLLAAAVGRLARHTRWPALHRAQQVTAAGVVPVLLGGTLLAAPPAGGPDTGADRAVDWVRRHAGVAVLVADDPVWTELLRAGVPSTRLVSYRKLGPSEGRAQEAVRTALRAPGAAGTVLLVGRRPGRAASALVVTAYARSVTLARFGPTEVRWLVHDVAVVGRAAEAERVARSRAGAALAAHPRLLLFPDTQATLRAGDVDSRLLVTLAALAHEDTVTVTGFVAVPGETGPFAPRRTVRLAQLNGEPLTPVSLSTVLLRGWLTAQQAPYRPAAITAVPTGGLLVTYLPPTPTGLLPA